jgi:hypothetical protein
MAAGGCWLAAAAAEAVRCVREAQQRRSSQQPGSEAHRTVPPTALPHFKQ